MATFFTEGHPLHTLSAGWRERKTQLRAEQLQDWNDCLYAVVSRDILSRRAEIHEALTTAVSTARRPADLWIPLWSYHATWYDEVPDPSTMAFAESQRILRAKGYNWSIGRAYLGSDPETVSTASDWAYMWGGGTPATVHDVVTHTNFNQRLALMFGDEFWVTTHRVGYKDITRPLPAVVSRFELRLHYFPTGRVPAHRAAILASVRAKYASYRPSPCPVYERPTLWKGVPSKVEPVVPTTLSYESPPTATPRSEPPPLAQRTNGGGLRPDNMTEVARSLCSEFDDTHGGIHLYEGPDAFQQAARDTVESCLDQRAPCHCYYHRESDSE
jgi:hypothetical protein